MFGFGGEAWAQTTYVCGAPGVNEEVRCTESGTGDIELDLSSVSISAEGAVNSGVEAFHDGTGKTDIDVRGSTITTSGAGGSGIYATHSTSASGSVPGDIIINVQNSTITTTNTDTDTQSHGIHAKHEAYGNIKINVQGGKITTSGSPSHGIYAEHSGFGPGVPLMDGNLDITAQNVEITTKGDDSHGIYGLHSTFGDVNINVQGSTITTSGHNAHGVYGSAITDVTGDVLVQAQGGSIRTSGDGAYGIYAHLGDENFSASGDAVTVRTRNGHSISTTGPASHGIVASYYGTAATGAIDITVGGPITVSGTGARGVQVGVVNNDVPEGMAALDDEGYRRQTVTVDSSISSQGPGIYLANGGRVVIGPQGSIDSASGIAILATGDTSGTPVIKPKLRVDLNLGGRQVKDAIGDNRILNEGGETVIAVNNFVLYDGTAGVTGNMAPNGVWDVQMQASGIVANEGFSAANFAEVAARCPEGQTGFPNCMFVERHAPRSALYEALPDVLLRLQHRDAVRAPRSRPEHSQWVRVTGRTGSQNFKRSTVGIEYDMDHLEVEAGRHILLDNGLDAWAALHYLDGTAEVSSQARGGDIDVQGLGLSLELCRGCESGDWYASGRIVLSRYDLDLSSDTRGRLKSGADATAWGLRLEAGRRLQRWNMQLIPRIRLEHANVSVDRFTDAVESRVSYSDEDRSAVALGVMVESASETEGGPSLWGSLDFEHRLGDVQTVARVSGEQLTTRPETDSLLLGAGGTWRWDGLKIHAGLSAREELGSGGEEYGATFSLDLQF